MRLTDILAEGNSDGDVRDLWDNTEAAGELATLPPGEYVRIS